MSEYFNLQMIPGGVPTVVHVSQFDKDRTWIFTPLYGAQKYTKPSGATAVLEATKPDDNIVVHEVTYNSDGTITVNLADMEQLTTAYGDAHGKIRVVNNGKTLASGSVIFAVDIAGVETRAKVSKTDIEAIESVIGINEEVVASRDAAKTSETNAANSAKAAASSASAASTSAGNASRSASAAASSQSAAKMSETNAGNSASAAANSASAAKTSETNAGKSATASANSAKTSESWAVGGTNTRSGENTNNSKYYSGQSASSAKMSQSYAVGGTGTRANEDADNAKAYAEEAKKQYDNIKTVTNVEIATKTKAGIVKPGEGVNVSTDGTISVKVIKTWGDLLG